jgi:SAM-dependent methyltransferase
MTNPKCPITGEPAVRNVQWIDTEDLISGWKHIFGAPARPCFGENQLLGLWESPTGLYFFAPMIEGDHNFYSKFHASLLKSNFFTQQSIRTEFERAARWIAPGDRVLDVGCGFASFRSVVEQADYVGLDPNFARDNNVEGVIDQTLQDHLVDNAGTYDAVCAFQVIEHVASPAKLFADMLQAARPGGLVIVGVPHVPSALTRIPNFLFNAPPNHLTWWTQKALAAIAERQGAAVESIEQVPWGQNDSLIYWMERCAPIRCRDIHYKDAWSWYAAGLISYLGGRLAFKVRGVPKTTDEGGGLLMVARRQAAQ